MMSTKLKFIRVAAAGTVCAFALARPDDAQAADSVVPSSWNVAPMTSGAYLEAFDTDLPEWAGGGLNAVTASFPAMGALPSRANAWFGANSKVMHLETDGVVITNTLAYPGAEGPVLFGNKPVYVDMRVRFDAMVDPPETALLDNVKLAVYVSSEAKLVAVHAGGSSTFGTALDTNLWYQLTIKMTNTTFDVLLNDVAVFTGLTVKGTPDPATLAGVNFYGTGLIDELYVSHGNPAYAITGPTLPNPGLPSPGANPPTDEQQTRINAWLNGYYPGLTTLTLTQDQLSTAYLLGELGGNGTTGLPVAYSFGISKIEMDSPTSLRVTLALTTGDDLPKVGPINGKIQLLGSINYDPATWVTLEGAITPSYADFDAGEATYTFAIPAGGYKFFKPQIVP